MSADEKVAYARVGTRSHLVSGEPVYVGQPEVALCGTVFIRQSPQPDSPPQCFDCHALDVDRLRFEAAQMLDQADATALALRSSPSRPS